MPIPRCSTRPWSSSTTTRTTASSTMSHRRCLRKASSTSSSIPARLVLRCDRTAAGRFWFPRPADPHFALDAWRLGNLGSLRPHLGLQFHREVDAGDRQPAICPTSAPGAVRSRRPGPPSTSAHRCTACRSCPTPGSADPRGRTTPLPGDNAMPIRSAVSSGLGRCRSSPTPTWSTSHRRERRTR